MSGGGGNVSSHFITDRKEPLDIGALRQSGILIHPNLHLRVSYSCEAYRWSYKQVILAVLRLYGCWLPSFAFLLQWNSQIRLEMGIYK